MEKTKELLKLTVDESRIVSQLNVPPHRPNLESSFYEEFSIKGIRVDRVEPGLITCTFKVPARLIDRNGYLSSGAIATLVDEIGAALMFAVGSPMDVSVDMSISYLSNAKAEDELEITSKFLGQKGGYYGTLVLLKNKATGEIVAEGRHSLFKKHASKL
ncbi:hypothetical protein PVL29_007596 [Vitis rotundifolia]|uniref:Acyl-coenzyme A thioesterase 13 n=1 Tax=Vitis rotundifolia TaxID=103349 RepID=A0AA39A1A5_VITRO|nr:hypothetical protein PVL29_007596 [Vitis rotundifolia]